MSNIINRIDQLILNWHESCKRGGVYGEIFTMDRILILSGESNLFSEVQEKIRDKAEIEIITCADSLNLIENYVSQHTELVILDIDMIKEGAIKLINIIRSIKKNIQIILILSKKNISICSDVLSLGVVSYLIKPLSIENLSKIVIATLKIKT